MSATFLSPITVRFHPISFGEHLLTVHLFYGKPNDLIRQSIPFAYFYLDIDSTDGNAHDIRVYSDITPRKLSRPSLFEHC